MNRVGTWIAVLVALLLPAGVGAAISAPATFAALHAPGPARAVPHPAPPVHDPARPTAAVVLGADGAVASDVLGPFETLAVTDRFNVYAVAADHDPVVLTGGLDLLPHLTFDELTDRLDGAAPDLVIVPALPADDDPAGAWADAQVDRGAHVVGVCNGAGVLAAAGVLDGRTATAHWTRVERYTAAHDRTDWVSSVRFVSDGPVVTTAGILSGLDGTLHAVEQLTDPSTADRAAAAIGWTRHRAEDPVHAPGGPYPVAVVNAALRWDPDRIGVVVTPGVGELELASVFDVHGGQSLAARTVALSADGGPVRTHHGLTVLPRDDLSAAGLDRMLTPGPTGLHAAGGFAFDAALVDLARTTDRSTAAWTAAVHEFPADGLVLDGPAWPWVPTLLPVGLGLVAAAITGILLRHRSRKESTTKPLPT
ncbi:DJ-1/PfpI family protein [Pseudonocardia xishanensis]|uniref:DJ-1/PfpI family protein n=1 Tax=Pseudonocardia xishanensis TaxID=630995 RepID=A0ABP8RIK1_9PSEU